MDADDARPLPRDANRRKRAAQPGSKCSQQAGPKAGQTSQAKQPAEPLSLVRRRQQRAKAWKQLDDEQKKQVIEDQIADFAHWVNTRSLPMVELAA